MHVHGGFYRPRWVAEQIEAGRVLSSVAALGGEIVGHYAPLVDEPGGALEIGVAAVHPAIERVVADRRPRPSRAIFP